MKVRPFSIIANTASTEANYVSAVMRNQDDHCSRQWHWRQGSGDRLLLVGALDHFQTEHDPGRDVGEILDLATVV
jgi:hypothetical protein